MKQMKNKLIAGAALASLAFGLVACGDDSSSSSPVTPNEDVATVSLTGVIFGSDYTTGELRWIDKDGKISSKSLEFYQDSKVIANGADLYVLQRMSKDNITKLDPEKLDDGAKEAVKWQFSLGDGANPTDMAFDGKNAWVALQNADSLVLISTEDGKASKSIKTGEFAYEGETSPYVADIEINDGKLYVLMQRYTMDPTTWATTYPKGLVAIYDASTGDLKDTVQLLKKNPTAMAFFDGALYVASQGEYNATYGTDADDERGVEKVNLKDKKSELIVSGEKLGGGVYAFVAEKGTAYAAIYKSYGDVPLVKIDLASKKFETVKGIADAEGSISFKNGVVLVGDRSYGAEKAYMIEDGEVTALESPKGAIAPYSVTLF